MPAASALPRSSRTGWHHASVDQEGGAALVPARRQRGHRPSGPNVPFRFYDKVPTKFAHIRRRRVREGGRARGAARGRAARRLRRAQRRADAFVREHRRVRRRRHDGRHLGDRRLVRADRQERAPLGRRGHRRRARAHPGQSHHHRGQLLHRRALGSRRRRDRRGELGAGHGRLHRAEHQDLRPRDAAASRTAACRRDRSSSPAACPRATTAASSIAPSS